MTFTTTQLTSAEQTNPTFIQFRRGFRIYAFCTEAVTPPVAPATLTINAANVAETVSDVNKCVNIQSDNYPNAYTKVDSDIMADVTFAASVISACSSLNIQFMTPFDVTGTACTGDNDRVVISTVSGGTVTAIGSPLCGTTVPMVTNQSPIPPMFRVVFERQNVETPGNGFSVRVCPAGCNNL